MKSSSPAASKRRSKRSEAKAGKTKSSSSTPPKPRASSPFTPTSARSITTVELIGHPTPCHSERGSPTTESKNPPKVRSALLVSATRPGKERPNHPTTPSLPHPASGRENQMLQLQADRPTQLTALRCEVVISGTPSSGTPSVGGASAGGVTAATSFRWMFRGLVADIAVPDNTTVQYV
jgi:hypothetical protein